MYKEFSRVDNSLRPYQQEAKKRIFALWDDVDNILFQMPTGTGKTRLVTSIISDIKAWGILNNRDYRILIIAHRIELIEQISYNLKRYMVAHGIIAGGKNRNLTPKVQVASVQTISHKSNEDIAKSLDIDFIIIDEAHHSTAKSYMKLWDLYPQAKKLGVTATPWRLNKTGFTTLYNDLVVSPSISEFIDDGWLAPYEYYSISPNDILKREIDGITEFDIEGDYKVSALENIVDRKITRARLLNSYLKFAKGKRGIIYSISRRHSEHICGEFREAGMNIVRIDSLTPREERRLYVRRFREGLIDIIVNVDIFSEGFDCPDIEFIQLARPTKSLVKYLQQVGRGLRPTQGKTKCIILDNVGTHLEFGLPDSSRDWYVSFLGESASQREKATMAGRNESKGSCKDLVETDDEMKLIQSIDSQNLSNNIPLWSDADDALLEVLYNDKKCSIDILANVFKQSEEIILSRIDFLHLSSNLEKQ